MSFAVLSFYPFEGCQFGQDNIQQSGAIHQLKSFRRPFCHHHLLYLINYAFGRNYGNTLLIATNCLKGRGIYVELQGRGKTKGTHHAKRIIAECQVRIARRTQDFLSKIVPTVKRIDQLPVIGFVQADGHSIDGKIAAPEVVFEAAVLHNGFTGFSLIGFPSGSHKFQLKITVTQLRCPKILENIDPGRFPQFGGHKFRQFYALSYCNYIDVLRADHEKDISNISSYQTAPHIHLFGCLR